MKGFTHTQVINESKGFVWVGTYLNIKLTSPIFKWRFTNAFIYLMLSMPYSHKYMKDIIINQISEGLQQFMNVHIYLMVVCEVIRQIDSILSKMKYSRIFAGNVNEMLLLICCT